MEVTRKKLSELKSPEKNVRRHTEKQMQEYVRSIKMFGQTKPILCDEDGEIIVGNGLYEALQRTGAQEADCFVMAGLTENMKKKLMLADNRVYELGVSDMDVFDEIVMELDGDFDIPGWDDDMLKMLTASMQQINEEINSYGKYDQDQVDGMKQTYQNQEYVPNTPNVTAEEVRDNDPMPMFAAQQPQAAMAGQAAGEGGEVSAKGQGEAAQQPQAASRYVICPKCGEKICL